MFQNPVDNYTFEGILADVILDKMVKSSVSSITLCMDFETLRQNNTDLLFKFDEHILNKQHHIFERKVYFGDNKSMQSKPSLNKDYTWFQRNYKELKSKYNGKWIAIANSKLICVDDTFAGAYKMAKSKGYVRPFITRVLPERWENH